MPPHRRRPAPTSGQAPPIRRPRVAGLRNRPDHEVDEQLDQPLDETPEEHDDEHVSGVLNGVLGEPPKAAEPVVEDSVEEAVEEPATATTAITTPVPADEPRGSTTRPKARQSRLVGADGDRRPAGKRRATGTARPSDLTNAETDVGAEPPRPARHAKVDAAPRGKAQMPVVITLMVTAIIFASLAVYFRGMANDLNSGDAGNTALTDSAATSQVKGQLTNAVQQTFSYNYTDLESTAKAVRENLAGKALCEYNLLFGEVKQYAPEQKIVLKTTVHELAVVRIDGDRAEALVYIDQLSTRVDVNKTVAVEGQFAVQAKRDGDHWKITEFDMFGQPLFNGKPAPKC